MRRGERPILQLPRPLLFGFAVIFAGQLVYHHISRHDFEARYRALDKPLEITTYRASAMGSERLLGYLLALRLQLHDNQAGRHFRYSLIDYRVLVDWLERLSALDPQSEYPMLLASRIYSSTGDESRLRLILGYIEREFDTNPQLHWRRLAEASVIAKHKLGDLESALRMAEKIAAQPPGVRMPPWARDLEFLLLADLNEFEAAIAIIQALLQSGSISDIDEQRFLREKLSEFQQKLLESQQSAEDTGG